MVACGEVKYFGGNKMGAVLVKLCPICNRVDDSDDEQIEFEHGGLFEEEELRKMRVRELYTSRI